MYLWLTNAIRMTHLEGLFGLVESMGHKGPVLMPGCMGPGRARTKYHSIQFKSALKNTESMPFHNK